FAVEFQIDDAVGTGMRHAALGIVFRRLRHVDPVGYALDDIEIVGREVGVDQRLIRFAPRSPKGGRVDEAGGGSALVVALRDQPGAALAREIN
ncbi:hypothetical protein, partial [Mesorhizobium sp. M1D.F.Ca.ET.234.01.1.1]|uniref:hypothetical protein n=1 Tax=Mesorhizobium sp. M1D.F.Ca.ET.234.01.1.1 TaxID=2563932 RepID=UPI00143F6B12